MRMRVSALVLSVVAVAACKSDPAGPVLDIEGTYVGNWTFESFDPNGPLASFTCPGTVTLAEQSGRSFGGTLLVTDTGDCTGLSPSSGDVLDGQVRGDGGIEFTVSVLPIVTPAGCSVGSFEDRMNGAVDGGSLTVFTTASLVCAAGPGRVQIRMEGAR